MEPIQTAHYRFHIGIGPAGGLAARSMEFWLSEPIERERAGPFFFQEPGLKWERLDEDQVIRVHRAEWALARLICLVCDIDPQFDVRAVLVVADEAIRLPFQVRDARGSPVAELALFASRSDVRWQGAARSYPIGKGAATELEDLMAAEPERLAECRIEVPWRKAIGWNGKKFLGQRILKRPEYYAKAAIAARQAGRERLNARLQVERHFVVREFAAEENDPSRNRSGRASRFTDIWPAPLLWAVTPNWTRALDEEGDRDQDETTVKPASEQRFISEDVDYTAGDAWLPDGRTIPALLHVISGEPRRIVGFEDATFWEFHCGPEPQGQPQLTAEQRQRFPLRIVSRLSRSLREPGATIRVIIDETGRVSPWQFDD